MIIMGGGICYWFYSDVMYCLVLVLFMLIGLMGCNGGGWVYYVGQEKVCLLIGWQMMVMVIDWLWLLCQVFGVLYWYVYID